MILITIGDIVAKYYTLIKMKFAPYVAPYVASRCLINNTNYDRRHCGDIKLNFN